MGLHWSLSPTIMSVKTVRHTEGVQVELEKCYAPKHKVLVHCPSAKSVELEVARLACALR